MEYSIKPSETKSKSITFPHLPSVPIYLAAKEYELVLRDTRRRGEIKEKSEKLNQLISQTKEIDWNIAGVDEVNTGVTLAYRAMILKYRGKDELFNKFIGCPPDKIKWNTSPENEKNEWFGVDIFYWAVFFAFNGDPQLFVQLLKSSAHQHEWNGGSKDPKNGQYGVTTAFIGFAGLTEDAKSRFASYFNELPAELVDWNAGPKHKEHLHYGISIAYWFELLDLRIQKKFLELPAKKINWNAGPKNEKNPDYGKTVAYCALDFYERGDQRLANKLLESPAEHIDWNAGPRRNEKHPEHGVTVACRALDLYEKGDPRFLNKLLELPPERIDWNAGPTDEKQRNQGMTLAYRSVVFHRQDDSRLLNKLLKLPAEKINWNAGPTNKQHLDCGKTLAHQAILLAFDGDNRLLNKLLELPADKINWDVVIKHSENPLDGLNSLYFAAALYFQKNDPRLLNKFLELPTATIDCNTASKNEKNTYYGITLLYLSALLSDNQYRGDSRLLTKCLQSYPNTIDWNAYPKNSKGLKSFSQLALELADKGNLILLDKLFGSPHASEQTWDSLNIHLLRNVFYNNIEHYAPLMMKLSLTALGALKRNLGALPIFHALRNFIDLSLAGHSINLTSKESKSLDEEEQDRPINTSELNVCLDKIKSQHFVREYHLGCFCVAQTFPSLAEEYYQKIPSSSILYSKAQYEFASLCLANAGALESGSDPHTQLLKKAFDASVHQWFFQDKKSDSKASASDDDSIRLIENIAKAAISLPGQGMSNLVLPDTFKDELQEFKRKTRNNEELMQFKLDHMWKDLRTHKKHQEDLTKLKQDNQEIKASMRTMQATLEQLKQWMVQQRTAPLGYQPQKRKKPSSAGFFAPPTPSHTNRSQPLPTYQFPMPQPYRGNPLEKKQKLPYPPGNYSSFAQQPFLPPGGENSSSFSSSSASLSLPQKPR